MPGSRGSEDEADDIVLRVLASMRRHTRERAKRAEENGKIRSRCPNFERIKERAARAIAPVKPADKQSVAPKDMLLAAKETNAGQLLPEPYLVYFLLVDVLDYKDLGKWEKLAYSIPVDFNGTAYLVEHRKFGLGLFAADPEAQEDDAKAIVHLIRKAVKAAQPYFDHLANEAADGSKLNLKNHSHALYERYMFFRQLFREKQEEVEKRKHERKVEEGISENGLIQWRSFREPVLELRREARWLGLAALEAFFSWTEHVFIHIAVLRGVCTTGRAVRQLVSADWSAKIKTALDIDRAEIKALYDELSVIRRQLRNYVAHGAFGKDGEAFSFHSHVGAVPLLLPHKRGGKLFRFGPGLDLDLTQTFNIIERFETHLWNGWGAGAKLYIQDYELPAILSMAADGTYERAMSSERKMVDFTKQIAKRIEDAANMDW